MNFVEATELDIAELYRDAYSIGNGSVTIDGFYAIAHETGFFLKYLLLNSYEKLPVLDGGNLADVASNAAYAYLFPALENIKSV